MITGTEIMGDKRYKKIIYWNIREDIEYSGIGKRLMKWSGRH